MKGIIETIARLIRAGQRAYARKWSFLALFAIAFFGSIVVLAEFDLLPGTKSDLALGEPAGASATLVASSAAAPAVAIRAEAPVKIVIAKIALDAPITNPASTEVEALDAELLKGAVRYPTSASLGETGNVVLFGHSSYLPVVKNQAYKTFNNIQKLTVGDSITVYSSTAAYTYRVRSVTKESAESGAIPLSVSGKVLTLSTCDSFGKKSDRFVVVADFVESHSLGV